MLTFKWLHKIWKKKSQIVWLMIRANVELVLCIRCSALQLSVFKLYHYLIFEYIYC